jgi:hypothetical protein
VTPQEYIKENAKTGCTITQEMAQTLLKDWVESSKLQDLVTVLGFPGIARAASQLQGHTLGPKQCESLLPYL